MSLTLDGTNGISASGGVNVLQNNSVVTGNLVDSAVTTAKIGDSQVTDAKVAGIAASKITSGTVATARLGSGTPGTGNFLRGDGSWQAIPASAPSTTDVLNATAGATAGAVGTYAFLGNTVFQDVALGVTRAGSSLRFANIVARVNWNTGLSNIAQGDSDVFRGGSTPSGTQFGTPSGTWRCMGEAFSNPFIASFSAALWLRIS